MTYAIIGSQVLRQYSAERVLSDKQLLRHGSAKRAMYLTWCLSVASKEVGGIARICHGKLDIIDSYKYKL